MVSSGSLLKGFPLHPEHEKVMEDLVFITRVYMPDNTFGSYNCKLVMLCLNIFLIQSFMCSLVG